MSWDVLNQISHEYRLISWLLEIIFLRIFHNVKQRIANKKFSQITCNMEYNLHDSQHNELDMAWNRVKPKVAFKDNLVRMAIKEVLFDFNSCYEDNVKY